MRAPARHSSLKEMPPILNAQSVTKQFGATPLFRDISITVEDGDRIGLIGPNGAGKSTLLALLAGQVEPDSGELAVRKRARAAYVPQDSRFAAGLTIRQVLEGALTSAHVNESEREGRLRELAGRAGFDDSARIGRTTELIAEFRLVTVERDQFVAAKDLDLFCRGWMRVVIPAGLITVNRGNLLVASGVQFSQQPSQMWIADDTHVGSLRWYDPDRFNLYALSQQSADTPV